MTTGSKGPESVLRLQMLSVDGGKQRTRVRTAAEDFLGRRFKTESVLQRRIFWVTGKQKHTVRAAPGPRPPALAFRAGKAGSRNPADQDCSAWPFIGSRWLSREIHQIKVAQQGNPSDQDCSSEHEHQNTFNFLLRVVGD